MKEFEQTPWDGEGQRSLACCSPWGCKVEYDLTTKWQWTTKQEKNVISCMSGDFRRH